MWMQMTQAESDDLALWRISSKSGGENCVEVAHFPDRVLMRDSKDRGGPVLTFSVEVWRDFIDVISAGRTDSRRI